MKHKELYERIKPYIINTIGGIGGYERYLITTVDHATMYLEDIEEDDKGFYYMDNHRKRYLPLRK